MIRIPLYRLAVLVTMTMLTRRVSNQDENGDGDDGCDVVATAIIIDEVIVFDIGEVLHGSAKR